MFRLLPLISLGIVRFWVDDFMKLVDAEGMLGRFFLFVLHFSVPTPDSMPRTYSGEATSIF